MVVAYLRVVKPEEDSERYKKPGPNVDCFDTKVSRVGGYHECDCPLEDNAAIMSVCIRLKHIRSLTSRDRSIQG